LGGKRECFWIRLKKGRNGVGDQPEKANRGIHFRKKRYPIKRGDCEGQEVGITHELVQVTRKGRVFGISFHDPDPKAGKNFGV